MCKFVEFMVNKESVMLIGEELENIFQVFLEL